MSKQMLIDERPLMVLPSLVKQLGTMERAVVLQQIHFLSTMPKSGKNIDGYHWVWGSYQEWCDTWFTFWGTRQLQRHILWLEENDYLISAKFKAGDWDHTKYYRINYDKLDTISNDTSVTTDDDTSVTIDDDESVAIIYTETTTDTSAKTTTDKLASLPVTENNSQEEDTDDATTLLRLAYDVCNRVVSAAHPSFANELKAAQRLVDDRGIEYGMSLLPQLAERNAIKTREDKPLGAPVAYMAAIANDPKNKPAVDRDERASVYEELTARSVTAREGWTAPALEPTVFAHIRESATWQCDWDKDSRVVHIRTRLQPELAEMRLARNVATALHTDPAYADWSYQFEAV